jgi:cyclopropane-fatty-acyl-phospholipid synthase
VSTCNDNNPNTFATAKLQHNSTMMKKPPQIARLFLKMLGNLSYGHLRVVTPDQALLSFGDVNIDVTAILYIHDWRACSKILRGGDIGFAQAYEAGWVSTNNLTALLRLAIRNENALDNAIFGGKLMGFWHKLKHWLRPNTRKGSRRNIHAHYDIGNAFYQLWLDPSWTYSSAIFDKDCSITLEQAQAKKYQRIIDNLQLKAGDRVLEIGCGWGGFAEHAAKQGIYIHGVTISEAQLEIAQQRIADQYLQDFVTLELCDYRDLSVQYDAIVSIEMFEAVGEQYWDTYFKTVAKHLKPNAKALIQTITIDENRFERYRSGTDFIQQYIFPGGMLPSPLRFTQYAEKHDLTTVDQFCFGKDYAETLRRWNENFNHHNNEINKLGFDTPFQRIWQLYFSYCEAGFDEGNTDVIQFTLQKNA